MWAPTVLFSTQHTHTQTQIAHLKILKIEHVFVLHVNPGHPIIRSFNKSWVGAQPSIYLFFPSYLFFLHPCLFGHVFDKSFGSTWPWHTLAFSKKSTAGRLLHASSKSPLGPMRPCLEPGKNGGPPAPKLSNFSLKNQHSQKGWFLKGTHHQRRYVPSLVF